IMIKIQSIVDSVRRYLVGCILQGELYPGQQIKEHEIASSLGISRPPIREALKLLEAEGLIVRKPNRGAFVATITESDAWEIYSLKSNLYEMATRLAFEKISKKNLDEWDDILSEMEKCVLSKPPDIIRYESLNKKFHDIMFKISGHQRLRKIAQILHNQVSRFSCMSLMNESHIRESLMYHQEIVIAIKKGNMDRAIQMTREHISKGLQIVQEIIIKEMNQAIPAGTETHYTPQAKNMNFIADTAGFN
ncbi:MAG TPA: GntR family transcriptional regulator, partial [Desulfobacteraceae bacterium]|nr:GntR family transcriptional regulator [Desulfobacteraceae bacterium]